MRMVSEDEISFFRDAKNHIPKQGRRDCDLILLPKVRNKISNKIKNCRDWCRVRCERHLKAVKALHSRVKPQGEGKEGQRGCFLKTTGFGSLPLILYP